MRKLMWFSVGFAAICAINAYLHHILGAAFMVLAAVAVVTAFLLCRKLRFAGVAACVLTGILLGGIWIGLYEHLILKDAKMLDGTTTVASIEVTGYSYETDYGAAVKGRLLGSRNSCSVLVYLDENISCSPGDVLHGTFLLRYTSHGGQRSPSYQRSNGIWLIANAQDDLQITCPETITFYCYPAIWAEAISQRISTIFSPGAAEFAKALLLGDRSGIDYETDTALRRSGITHVIAVSGLHVTMLFAVIHLLFGNRRYLLLLMGTPLLLLFGAITGLTPSIVRACIMQFLYLLAMVLDREYDPPTALGFSALVMLLINPMVIVSISFQLSMACMIGIYLFYDRIYNWFTSEKRMGSVKGKGLLSKVKRWFVSSISVSISATVFTTALIAYYFGSISLVSILTNLLLVWLITYIFYGIILICLSSLLHIGLGILLGSMLSMCIHAVLHIVRFLSNLPFAAVYTESVYITVWLIASYVLLSAFLLIRTKPVLVYGSCVGICLCAALLASWLEPTLYEYCITVLDVGQGQCILLQSEGRTFMVDCGGSQDTETADIAAERLLSMGISHLDGIVLTHYDYDHVGGVPYLLSRISADSMFLPAYVDEYGMSEKLMSIAGNAAISVDKDMTITFGNTVITLFAPELHYSENENSICVLFQTKNCDILITGDRGTRGEQQLLQRAKLPKLEYLIAGHHGSSGSTGDVLLQATRPDYVLISAGRNNRYGLPAPVLLERLEKYGCTVLRTDRNGTLVIRG